MTDARRTLEIVVVALLITLAAVWAVGRASTRDAAARVRAEMRDSVAFEVARAIAPLRRDKDRADAARLAAERKLAKVRQDARTTLASTSHTIDSLRLAFGNAERDSVTGAAPSDSVPRSAFTDALAQYDSLAAALRAYIVATDTALAAAEVARTAERAVLAQTERALTSMTQARDAWQQAATCRLAFGIRCPTRTQAFVTGAIVTAGVIMVVR